MRIAYLSYEYPPETGYGGIATYTQEAARMLAERGHEVEVFCSTPAAARTEYDGQITVHRVAEGERRHFSLAAGHAFAVRHRDAPFDVVEAPEYQSEARAAMRLVRATAYVVRLHTPTYLMWRLNSPEAPGLSWRWIAKQLSAAWTDSKAQRGPRPLQWLSGDGESARLDEAKEAETARAATCVVSPSRSLRDYAIKHWGLATEAVVHLPNPFSPAPELLAASIALDTSSQTIGYFGRLEKRKGILTLASAIPEIAKQVPGVTFRFVGRPCHLGPTEGDAEEYLAGVCRRAGVEATFTGQLPAEEARRMMTEVDLCVFPSRWENFPYVCLEAMAAGRAIVGSAAGGMCDMLDDGKCGVLIEPNNPKALAMSVGLILKDPQRRVELGKAARARVLSTYTPSALGSLFESVYESARNGARLTQRHSVEAGR